MPLPDILGGCVVSNKRKKNESNTPSFKNKFSNFTKSFQFKYSKSVKTFGSFHHFEYKNSTSLTDTGLLYFNQGLTLSNLLTKLLFFVLLFKNSIFNASSDDLYYDVESSEEEENKFTKYEYKYDTPYISYSTPYVNTDIFGNIWQAAKSQLAKPKSNTPNPKTTQKTITPKLSSTGVPYILNISSIINSNKIQRVVELDIYNKFPLRFATLIFNGIKKDENKNSDVVEDSVEARSSFFHVPLSEYVTLSESFYNQQLVFIISDVVTESDEKITSEQDFSSQEYNETNTGANEEQDNEGQDNEGQDNEEQDNEEQDNEDNTQQDSYKSGKEDLVTDQEEQNLEYQFDLNLLFSDNHITYLLGFTAKQGAGFSENALQLYYGDQYITYTENQKDAQKQLNFQYVDFDQYVKSLKPKEDDTNKIIKHCTANPIGCTKKTSYFFVAYYIPAKYHPLMGLAISVPNLDGYLLAGVKKSIMGTTGTALTGSIYKGMTGNIQAQDWMKDASLYQGLDKTLLNPAVALIIEEIPCGTKFFATVLVLFYSHWDFQDPTKVTLAGGSFGYCVFSSIDSKKPWNEEWEKAFFKCTTGIVSSLITGVSLTHQLPKPDDILGATFKSGMNQHTKSDQYYGYWWLSEYYTGNNVIPYIPEYTPKILVGIDAGIDVFKLYNNPTLKNSFELVKSSALAAGFCTKHVVLVASFFMVLDIASTLYEIQKVYNEDGGFVAAQGLLKPIGVLFTFGLTIWHTPALIASPLLIKCYMLTAAAGTVYNAYSFYQEYNQEDYTLKSELDWLGFYIAICDKAPSFIKSVCLGLLELYQAKEEHLRIVQEKLTFKEALTNKGEFKSNLYELIYKPYFELEEKLIKKVELGKIMEEEVVELLNKKVFKIEDHLYDICVKTEEYKDVIHANCINESSRSIDEIEIHDGGYKLEVLNTYNYSETSPELYIDIELSLNYLLLIGILII